MSNKICTENIITNNCTLVKGPNNKLHLLLPVTPDVVEKINATNTADTQEMAVDASSKPPAKAPAESSPDDNETPVPNGIREWVVTHSISSSMSTHRLTHRLDHRTYIELVDFHDGYGSVRRKVKPRYGKSVKDQPLNDQPIALCLERILEWVAENPQSWTRYDDRGSATNNARRRKRMKLYNSLFGRR